MSFFEKTALTLLLAMLIGNAQASETAIEFDIPAQNLSAALKQLANQAHLQMLYDGPTVQGKHSTAVQGHYTSRQALQKLLDGTGLVHTFTADNSVAVKTDPSQVNPTTSSTLLPVTVTGNREYDVTDPYNKDYVLPTATAGTKTDTPIMETPLNVQVISKQVLKDQQVITLDQALKNVSGVTTANQGFSGGFDGGIGTNQSLFLRGIFTSAYFRDGFRLQQGSGEREMANVESVEVLKGPVAVLYGQVDPGGMVNVITKQPLATPYYGFSQQFGSYNLYRTTLDATGPLTSNKNLLYRFNASYQNNKSFREFVSNDDVFLAPVLKWNISPRTQITFEMEYNHQHKGLDAGSIPFSMPFANGQLLNVPRSRNYGEYSPGSVDRVYGSFNWSHSFNDDWTIKHRFAVDQQQDVTSLYYPYITTNTNVQRLFQGINQHFNTYSTNLDLIGHFDTWGLHHTLLLGGDYFRLNSVVDRSLVLDPVTFFGFSQIDLFNPVHPGTPFPSAPQSAYVQNIQTDQYGLYFQDQIKLPYGFNVIGGIRYQYLHQHTVTDGVLAGGFTDTALSQDAVTPRVGIVWRPQDWLSFYGNYTENFGANTGIVYPNKPIPPSSAKQYVIVPLFLRKLVLGIPAQASGKNYAATIAFGGPSRPASLVAYPTRGMQLSYAMTRRDFVKPVFSLRFAP